MDIQTQKQIADKVLKELEAIDPDCLLAGGAPRDWTLGKLATDLDFYFQVDERKFDTFEVMNMLNTLGLNVHIKDTETEAEYDRNPYLFCVYDGMQMEMKVQFMFISVAPRWMVDQFALDICQAYYKNGKIETTKDFDLAVEKKIIRITNPLYMDGDAYVQKIINKFPEFTFVGYAR